MIIFWQHNCDYIESKNYKGVTTANHLLLHLLTCPLSLSTPCHVALNLASINQYIPVSPVNMSNPLLIRRGSGVGRSPCNPKTGGSVHKAPLCPSLASTTLNNNNFIVWLIISSPLFIKIGTRTLLLHSKTPCAVTRVWCDDLSGVRCIDNKSKKKSSVSSRNTAYGNLSWSHCLSDVIRTNHLLSEHRGT